VNEKYFLDHWDLGYKYRVKVILWCFVSSRKENMREVKMKKNIITWLKRN